MTSRREEIEAAVAAYDQANPLTPLPLNATRLLVAMFPTGDVCQRTQASMFVEGFDRKTLIKSLGILTETGFLSKDARRRGYVATYRLHLPPVRR
jgi:hypothetical protein